MNAGNIDWNAVSFELSSLGNGLSWGLELTGDEATLSITGGKFGPSPPPSHFSLGIGLALVCCVRFYRSGIPRLKTRRTLVGGAGKRRSHRPLGDGLQQAPGNRRNFQTIRPREPFRRNGTYPPPLSSSGTFSSISLLTASLPALRASRSIPPMSLKSRPNSFRISR